MTSNGNAQTTPVQSKADASFESFVNSFIGVLADDHFSTDGSLPAYLSTPESNRSGDEANIVDHRITQVLLLSLGYATKEIDYNEQHGTLRPDFAIKIDEYPRPACFIVEDKNTTTLDLRRHRPQLQGYMTQNGAPRGMLINGHAILVYDQLESGLQTPSIELSLSDAVLAWRGEHLLAQGEKGVSALDACGLTSVLVALWRRFKRDSFASLQRLIDDMTLQKDCETEHRTDGKTWTPTPALPETPHQADKALEELIKKEGSVIEILKQICDAKQDISDQLESLFERIIHPPIKEPINPAAK
ncbi:MAG: hypothetical protein WCH01_14165 [Methylococcaceae bacterium]